MFVEWNPNPASRKVGDCTVRALSRAFRQGWEQTYLEICMQGFHDYDMPSSNAVWGTVLRKHGFVRHALPDTCPDCYTVDDFCREHPQGLFVISCPSHVVCVEDGDVFDTWDSREQTAIYYWSKG